MSQPSSSRRTSFSNHIWAVFIRSSSGFSPSLDAVFSHPLRGSYAALPGFNVASATGCPHLRPSAPGRLSLCGRFSVDAASFFFNRDKLFHFQHQKKTKKQKNQKLLCAFPLSFALFSFRSFLVHFSISLPRLPFLCYRRRFRLASTFFFPLSFPFLTKGL